MLCGRNEKFSVTLIAGFFEILIKFRHFCRLSTLDDPIKDCRQRWVVVECDYRFDQSLTDEEIKAIENEVNRVIAADLTISESDFSIDHARERFNLSRLPDDAGDRVRIVSIGDYDHCPCIGVHVTSTHEIGRFRITSSGYENGVPRVRFKFKRPERK
jgi:misacylated tRNA(Ala) deacylase